MHASGLVGLQADDLLKIFQALVDVAGAVCGQTADDLGLHIQHAALGALGLLQLLQCAQSLSVASVGPARKDSSPS